MATTPYRFSGTLCHGSQEVAAATRIQALWRGFVQRQRYEILQARSMHDFVMQNYYKAIREDAAVAIQRWWKGLLRRTGFYERLELGRQELEAEEAAVVLTSSASWGTQWLGSLYSQSVNAYCWLTGRPTGHPVHSGEPALLAV
eukprot:TRINITY_DN80134_c0_g1_i1.p1 TRINITY_DN80134_c0_g1~~TRINITY_DN80134_c0_g1_i1.p1  ORF type:complete len:144 (-),score=16.74 TRINITY_DN80134_c0_g1_i1:16-447(-)